YDADGNLTNDGRWYYTWDAENRLIRMATNTTVGPQISLTFEYDSKSRRIRKQVWYSGSATNDLRFVYDGWNLITTLNSQLSTLNSFMWGLDLSGSIQGAGGVGGLLEINDPEKGIHFASFDGNGNLNALVKAADGTTSARYEFGPFGEVTRATGPMAKANPFRFSTKYQDDETELLYYGYRHMSTSIGRWLGRDPLAERGGNNLYSFLRNGPIHRIDVLGFFEMTAGTPSITISGNTITVHEYTYGPWSEWEERISPAGSVDWLYGSYLLWKGCKCQRYTIYQHFDNIQRSRTHEVLEQDTIITVSPNLQQREAEQVLAVWALAGHAAHWDVPGVMESIYSLLRDDSYSFNVSHSTSQYYANEYHLFWRLTGVRTVVEDFDVTEKYCHGWLWGPKEFDHPYENPYEGQPPRPRSID
ncbi:MAG TPA: RHS repeat-associated core domain-containing protein, partial [Verrucomicrobiae bacterium]